MYFHGEYPGVCNESMGWRHWVNTTKRGREGKGNNEIILISKMRNKQCPAVGKYGQGEKIHFNKPWRRLSIYFCKSS